jgi:uncharacterized protein YndB with AHSA1/START domain
MKWLVISALSLTGVVLLVILIGALLPRKHVVARSVSLHQPPETVWKLITGPPTWRPGIKSYQELPTNNSQRMWRETDERGQTITYEVVESSPPRRLVTRIADPKLPFGGTWTYEIAPTNSGCSLTITENGEVYNPLFRFASRFVLGRAATIDAYVKALTAKLA